MEDGVGFCSTRSSVDEDEDSDRARTDSLDGYASGSGSGNRSFTDKRYLWTDRTTFGGVPLCRCPVLVCLIFGFTETGIFWAHGKEARGLSRERDRKRYNSRKKSSRKAKNNLAQHPNLDIPSHEGN